MSNPTTDPAVNPDPLLTVAQAVEYSGFSQNFIYTQINTGTLAAVRFGTGPRRAIRIRRSVLDDYLATGDAR
jgi:excisionase family DNA binding protein